MDEIPNLGTTEDRQICLEKQRVDSTKYRALVADAQKKLYDEGYAVDGDHVDKLLKGESLVPTEVRLIAHGVPNACLTTSTPRTPFCWP